MVREIIHDPMFLALKSENADENDRQVITDLLDTLRTNLDRCVGMAANMIGVRKNIIVVHTGWNQMVMINPRIISKKKEYTATEGCLSLAGERETKRYEEIEVIYLDEEFRTRQSKYTGWIAEIIQHETDHCNGILI